MKREEKEDKMMLKWVEELKTSIGNENEEKFDIKRENKKKY